MTCRLDALRRRNLIRNGDAADRAMLEARKIGDMFVDMCGLNPCPSDRAKAVKAIAERLDITTDKVNARLYLLRGRRAEVREARERK